MSVYARIKKYMCDMCARIKKKNTYVHIPASKYVTSSYRTINPYGHPMRTKVSKANRVSGQGCTPVAW